MSAFLRGVRGWRVRPDVRDPEAVGRGLLLVATGLGLGIPAALALARLVSSLLYGVTPWEPGPVLAAAAVMLAVGGLASPVPVVRARSVDSAEAP